MSDTIDPSIQHLAVDITLLKPLQGNPRKGNVNAIKESYLRFGQLKPIVAVADEDGTYTVIAGNHQLQAALDLGWTQIAVATVALDSDDAIAFALADNKVSELGSIDNEALIDMLASIDIENPLMESLGWDDFAVAAIENSVMSASTALKSNDGWTAPQIVSNPAIDNRQPAGTQDPTKPVQVSENGVVTASTPIPTSTIVTQGSTSTGMSGTSNASVQFTLVFDDPSQQSRWYSFLRWLKMSDMYSGETTSERLIDFIETHAQDS